MKPFRPTIPGGSLKVLGNFHETLKDETFQTHHPWLGLQFKKREIAQCDGRPRTGGQRAVRSHQGKTCVCVMFHTSTYDAALTASRGHQWDHHGFAKPGVEAGCHVLLCSNCLLSSYASMID